MKLVICRNIKDFHILNKIKGEDEIISVASDDPLVHLKAQNIQWIKKVYYIETDMTVWDVGDDVIKILDQINLWLKLLSSNQNIQEINYWIKHAEGDKTTQKIQDLLLLINYYETLLQQADCKEVYVISSYIYFWEDEILQAVVKKYELDFFVIHKNHYWFGKIRFLLLSQVKDFFVISKTIRIKLFSKKINIQRMAKDKAIIFQLCSNAAKHIIRTIDTMKEILKRNQFSFFLTWKVTPKNKIIKENELETISLETYCSFFDIILSIFLKLRIFLRAKNLKSNFNTYLSDYKNIRLYDYLWVFIEYFILGELPDRYRYIKSIDRFLNKFGANILAIRPWTTKLFEGSSLLKEMEKFGLHPLTFFDNFFETYVDSPYEKSIENCDIEFVSNENIKKFMMKRAVPEKNIKVIGSINYEIIKNFKQKNTRQDSLIFLGLPDIYKTYILLDFNVIIRGLISSKETISAFNFILDYVSKHYDICFLIKPHPGVSPVNINYLQKSIRKHKLDNKVLNIFVISKEQLPYHALNISDILITKYSAIGIQALYFQKIVLSLFLDNNIYNENFKVYGNKAIYLYSIEELEQTLNKIIYYPGIFNKYPTKTHSENGFLDNIDSGIKSSSYKMADILLDSLRLQN